MTLVNGHIINPGAEIGRFINKLVSRFLVNISTCTHMSKTHTHMKKHKHLPIIIFFSPLQKMLAEMSERIGK